MGVSGERPDRALPTRFGSYQLSGQSALANELMTVRPAARQTLMLPDLVVIMIDVIVTVARLFTDDSDPRKLQDRLADLESLLPPLSEEQMKDILDRALRELNGVADPQHPFSRLMRKAKSPTFRKVIRRLVGAAQYDRLESALHSDSAVIIVAMRRMLRYLMPLAVAIDDCTGVLTPSQVSKTLGGSKANAAKRSYLDVAVQLDAVLDRIFEGKLPLHLVPKRPGEGRALELDDLEQIADDLHVLIAGQTREKLSILDAVLARKLKGARDALEMSADAASQAANSLIEFIDRLLRRSFTEDFVLSWARDQMPNDFKQLVYVDSNSGRQRPTKRCQALCFVYGGLEVAAEAQSDLHEVMAAGLHEIRQQLQAIKHADEGTTEELAQLRRLMAGVEGFFT
jgi:hypothetical protein